MPPTTRRIHLLVGAWLAGTCFAAADERAPSPSRVKPPKITLLAVARANLGDQQLFSLTLEVANPNDAALVYTGYSSDSFDPPLTAGQISPLCHIELKRDGKWQIDPQKVDCGFGLGDVDLAARSSATFGVMIPADDWQAVKVGIGHYPGWSSEETSTTTIWSTEIARDAIETAAGKSLSQTVPERNLPVGKWTIEFANGVVESGEICKDGTASIVEPERSSRGTACEEGSATVIRFDDDRVERWTPVGERQVVEHWFPASHFSLATPVFGIAARCE